MLAALLQLSGSPVELLLFGGELGSRGLLRLSRFGDLADQRVDLLVALGELVGNRRLTVLYVRQRRLLGGEGGRGGRRMQKHGDAANSRQQHGRGGQETHGRS